jgi:ParB-like nuclease domain
MTEKDKKNAPKKPPKLKTKTGRKDATERPTLKPVTGSVTIAEIEELIAKSNGATAPAATHLERQDIHVAERGVFQWRRPDQRDSQWLRPDQLRSTDHITTLVSGLKATGAPFKPILVFWAGDRFFAVDGHHRLAAYDLIEWKAPIPVEVFVGSLGEARMEALDRNIKDQLPMTDVEKREVAWQLVKENPPENHPDHLSKEDVRRRTTASIGTINNMRAKWKEIKAAGDKGLLMMDWVKARRWPVKDHDAEDWQREKVNAIYDLLVNSKLASLLSG